MQTPSGTRPDLGGEASSRSRVQRAARRFAASPAAPGFNRGRRPTSDGLAARDAVRPLHDFQSIIAIVLDAGKHAGDRALWRSVPHHAAGACNNPDDIIPAALSRHIPGARRHANRAADNLMLIRRRRMKNNRRSTHPITFH